MNPPSPTSAAQEQMEERTCEIEGCSRKHSAKGLCQKHYMRKCRTGNELTIRPHRKIHGMVGTRIYKIWQGMVSRCTNPKQYGYQYYGGRGIAVCEEWRKFTGFYKDMGGSYGDGLSLDRIDADAGYDKGNCRWIPIRENNARHRRDHSFQHDGKTVTLRDLSKLSGIKSHTLRERLLRYGYTVEQAISFPIHYGRNR